MIQSERERHAQDAINEFVQYSCACILPGTEGHVTSEAGSGVIICTRNRHYVVLTAKHIAENAKREEYRLGFFRCSKPIPNFVAAIMPFPNDVDVALLIVKDDLALPLKQLAITPETIPTRDVDIQEQDSLVLNGYPAQKSYYSKEKSEQGFKVLSYWCGLSTNPLDKKKRYRMEWKDAQFWRSDKGFDLQTPKGMSGGPLWRFRRPASNDGWSAREIGKIVGIQSAWDRKETVFIEPVQKWSKWFHESILKVDEFYG
jgi:hypothetical protein